MTYRKLNILLSAAAFCCSSLSLAGTAMSFSDRRALLDYHERVIQSELYFNHVKIQQDIQQFEGASRAADYLAFNTESTGHIAYGTRGLWRARLRESLGRHTYLVDQLNKLHNEQRENANFDAAADQAFGRK